MAELSPDIKTTTDDMEQLVREVADAAATWKRARKADRAHEVLDERIRALAATDIVTATAVSEVTARLGSRGLLGGARSSSARMVAALLAGMLLGILLSLAIGTLLFRQWNMSFTRQVREEVLAELRKEQQVVPTATPLPTLAPSATLAPTLAPSATLAPTLTPGVTPPLTLVPGTTPAAPTATGPSTPNDQPPQRDEQ